MISRVLLDSLWILAAVLVAVQLVLIAIWSRLRSRGAGRAVWIGFAAIPTLLILSAVVVTPRERIIIICHDLADAVEANNPAGIEAYLSGDFQAGGLDRLQFMDHAEATLERFSVYYPELRRFEVTFPRKDKTVATFNVFCRIESPEAMLGWLPTRWRLTFRYVGGAWKVTNIESIPIPPLHIDDLTDLPR